MIKGRLQAVSPLHIFPTNQHMTKPTHIGITVRRFETMKVVLDEGITIEEAIQSSARYVVQDRLSLPKTDVFPTAVILCETTSWSYPLTLDVNSSDTPEAHIHIKLICLCLAPFEYVHTRVQSPRFNQILSIVIVSNGQPIYLQCSKLSSTIDR